MQALYVGLFAIALVIGFLSGASSTPVVGTIIPLIFSLITAGGVVYVLFGKERDAPSEKLEGNEANKEESEAGETKPLDATSKKAKLLGLQLLIFSIGYLPGIYAGVWSKFYPESLWPSQGDEYSVGYLEIEFTDLRLAHAFMDLDYKFYQQGVALDDRKKMLKSIDASINNRMNGGLKKSLEDITRQGGNGLLSKQDLEALEQLVKSPDNNVRSKEITTLATEPLINNWIRERNIH